MQHKTKAVNRELDALSRRMDKMALNEVERLARKVMAENPVCIEFCMAMGSASFKMKDGNWLDGFYIKRPYAKDLFDFIGEWDGQLKLTGTPMRFTATSKTTTNW